MSLLDSLEAVASAVAMHRSQGLRIVTTNGCFDLLHTGHAGYLGEAKALGEVLVVGVNSDRSVRRLKGAGRPVRSQRERALLVDALKPVDYTFIFDEDDPRTFIRVLRPDIHVKGGDYSGDIAERPDVEAGGGRVVVVSRVETPSTSEFLKSLSG